MGIRSALNKAWRIWGDWNNLRELLDLLGWKEWLRESIISILLYLAGGGVVGTFIGALSVGDPISVLIAALVVGILTAALRCIFLLNRALSGIAENHGPGIAQAPSELGPNVDARVAFYDILANSEWSRQQQPGVDHPISDWLARRLDQETHNLLRQGRLKAWGAIRFIAASLSYQ